MDWLEPALREMQTFEISNVCISRETTRFTMNFPFILNFLILNLSILNLVSSILQSAYQRYKNLVSSVKLVFATFDGSSVSFILTEGCGPQVISGDSVEILIWACPLFSSSTVRSGIYFPPILSPRSNLNHSLVVLEKYVIEYCESRYFNVSASY